MRPSFRWRRSLFKRLLWIQLSLVSGVWLVFCLITWSSLHAQGDGMVDSDLRLVAGTLAAMSSVHAALPEQQAVAERLARLNLEVSDPPMAPHEAGYQLWSAEGRLLLRWPQQTTMPEFPPRLPRAGARRAELGDWVLRGQYSEDGRVYAVAGYARTVVARLEQMVIRQAVIGMLVLWAMVGLMLWVAAKLGLRPVRRLAAALARRAADDFSPLGPVAVHAELQPLAETIDSRNAAVAAMMKREREFFADAAHELRTPLAALEVQAHVLAGAPAGAERLAALQSLEAGVQRCAASLNKLLLLARVDAQSAGYCAESVDLAAVVRDAVARHAPRALASNIALAYEGAAAIAVVGDAGLLATALDCLIDNALRHGGGATAITVAAGADALAWWIEVADDGVGIARADQERVFERFVRGSTQAEGSGLGLAIVRRIAVLHHGRAAIVASHAGCRLRITGKATI